MLKDALEYEQISDDLMILDSSSASLRFNVKLYSRSANGSAESFHKEFKYDSKFTNRSVGYSIRRNFTYFLSINGLKTYTSQMPLLITISDMLLFKAYITNAYKWITSMDTYAIKNNQLIIKGQYEPITMMTIYNKTISFEPTIITKMNDLKTQGIRMTIDNEWVINIDANKFAGMIYLIDSIDMYNAALTLINYLPRPEFGVNIISDFSTPMSKIEQERRNDTDLDQIVGSPLKQRKSNNISGIEDL